MNEVFYQALLTRDPRFDGKFFVGVKTTGIYCRPICPARPKRENIEFFASRHAAELAGFRPCLRCRPEAAPESPAWLSSAGKSPLVRRALRTLSDGEALRFDEDRFARRFGVTARHLRRLFVDEIGKTPKQIAFENRLNLARKLIVESRLPITEVAFASGFRSVRRFNDAFRDRFKKPPRDIRRRPEREKEAGLRLTLAYRPPFDFETLLGFYRSHRIGNLEWFEDGKMGRIIHFAGKTGKVMVANDAANNRLEVEIDFPDPAYLPTILSRVRALFDLDADPVLIANSLEVDPGLKKLWRKHPGLRLPSGWDGFEVGVSSILGQAVSIERGRALVADLIELLGEQAGEAKLFPTPQKVASSSLEGLKTTGGRKAALKEFARQVAEGELSLEPAQEVEKFIEKVTSIRGLGPWSASYMALKILRHTDAFPETDLIIARALEKHPKEIIARLSPWRAYAAILLWREYAQSLTKKRRMENFLSRGTSVPLAPHRSKK